MKFIKVHPIVITEHELIRRELDMVLNLDSIEFCKETDISLREEKWITPCSKSVLAFEVEKNDIGSYATEVVLKNGLSILVVENINYFCN